MLGHSSDGSWFVVRARSPYWDWVMGCLLVLFVSREGLRGNGTGLGQRAAGIRVGIDFTACGTGFFVSPFSSQCLKCSMLISTMLPRRSPAFPSENAL